MTKDECKKVVLDIIADIAPDEDLSNVRFPAFVRRTNEHDGNLSPLVHSFDELTQAIAGAPGAAPLNRHAFSPERVVAVRYLSEHIAP